jgi:hypothetical protein
LAAIICSPMVVVHALVHEDRDEGLLELDFRDAKRGFARTGTPVMVLASGAIARRRRA